MKKVVLSLMAASVLLLSGCGQKNADNSKPVIKVNDSVITEKMVEDSINTQSAVLGKLDKKSPEDSFLHLIYKNKAVNDVILKELLRQEAKKRNITVSEKEIDAKIDEIIEKFGGKAKFEAHFAANKIDKNEFRKTVEFELMNEKIVNQILGEDIVSEKEVKDFYDKNKEKYFVKPEEVKASHILISASEPAIRSKITEEDKDKKLSEEEINKKVKAEMDEAKNRAEKVLEDVKANPEKFAEIAKKESQDPSSAQKGGDLGFFSKDKMVPAFAKAAFDTKPGEISGLVKTEYGYHIIKVVDRKKAGEVPFDEVKDKIKNYLSDQKKMDALKKLLIGLRNNAKIEYLDEEYDPEKIQQKIQEHIKKQKEEKGLPGKPIKKEAEDKK